MGKLIKGLAIYAIIISIIASVLGIIAFGIMFFTASNENPFTVFGYRAVYAVSDERPQQRLKTNNLANESQVTINIHAGAFPLHIFSTSTHINENVIVYKSDNLFGVAKGNYDKDVVIEEDEENATYTITVPQLDGYISYNRGSGVRIALPSKKNFIYDLNITTTSGTVTIDGEFTEVINNVKTFNKDRSVRVSDLNIQTVTGNVFVKNMGRIEAGLEPALDENENPIIGVRNLDSYFESIALKTQTGRFDFSNIENLKLAAVMSDKLEEDVKFSLEAVRTDIKLKNLYGAISIFADDVKIDADTINTMSRGFKFNAPAGYFNVKEIITENAGFVGPIAPDEEEQPAQIDTMNTIVTDKTNINVNKIVGDTSIVSGHGGIFIDVLDGDAILKTTNGSIRVNKTTGGLEAESQRGDITIGEYQKTIKLTTSKGRVKASFIKVEAVEGEPVPVLQKNAITYVTSTDGGSVELLNISNPVKVHTVRAASVTVHFNDLLKSNVQDLGAEYEFKLAGGNLQLNISAGRGFNLLFEGSQNAISGEIATLNIRNNTVVGQVTPFFGATASDVLFGINLASGSVEFKEIITG